MTTTLKFHDFQEMLKNQKKLEKKLEQEYIEKELKKEFHKLIKFSAQYKGGKLVIPAHKLLESKLPLGIKIEGKVKYYTFSSVFAKFIIKCKNEKFAQKYGVKKLEFTH